MNPYEHIVDYLSKTLSEKDRLAFELAMDEDVHLKKQVDEQMRLAGMIEDHMASHQSRRYLDSLHRDENKSRFKSRPILSIAAVFVGLLILASVVISRQYNPQHLADQYYFDVTLNGVRGGQAEDDWTEAVNHLWKNRQFNKVIETVEMASDTLSSLSYLKYLEAHASFQLELYPQAASLFGDIAASPDNPYRQNADWQLVLTTLHNDNLTVASQRLEAIAANSDHVYHEKAVELKKQMESIWFRWSN